MDNITRNLIQNQGRCLARLQARQQEIQRATRCGHRDGVFIGVLLASVFWLAVLLVAVVVAYPFK